MRALHGKVTYNITVNPEIYAKIIFAFYFYAEFNFHGYVQPRIFAHMEKLVTAGKDRLYSAARGRVKVKWQVVLSSQTSN